jgi:hypothetical protein
MLRDVNDGEAPANAAAAAAAVGGPPPARSDQTGVDMEEIKLRESAARKRVAKDGKGCLADLDEADRRWPNSARSSIRPDGMMNIRGACLMLAGDCENGRKQYRMAMERFVGAKNVDTVVGIEADNNGCGKKK